MTQPAVPSRRYSARITAGSQALSPSCSPQSPCARRGGRALRRWCRAPVPPQRAACAQRPRCARRGRPGRRRRSPPRSPGARAGLPAPGGLQAHSRWAPRRTAQRRRGAGAGRAQARTQARAERPQRALHRGRRALRAACDPGRARLLGRGLPAAPRRARAQGRRMRAAGRAAPRSTSMNAPPGFSTRRTPAASSLRARASRAPSAPEDTTASTLALACRGVCLLGAPLAVRVPTLRRGAAPGRAGPPGAPPRACSRARRPARRPAPTARAAAWARRPRPGRCLAGSSTAA